MRLISDQDLLALGWPPVLAALRQAFADPGRYHMAERVALPAPAGGSWLTMPCADVDGWFGVKQVSVLPHNPALGLPSVQAWYTLMGPDGAPVLATDAGLLTKVRTSAVSALAADALAPEDAGTLLVVGSGSLSPWMVRAHLQVRHYRRVWVWGRRPERAQALAEELQAALGAAARSSGAQTAQKDGGPLPEIMAVADLEAAVRGADVVTVATTSQSPLVRGAWLRPGQHLDLVGAFVHQMRESDAEAVARSQVVVDDRQAALAEAGDLHHAAAEGWSWDLIAGDLHELLSGRLQPARDRPTLFKSVGLAFEDLAVARLLAGSAPAVGAGPNPGASR